MTQVDKIIKLGSHDGEAVAGYLSGYLNVRPTGSHENFCRVLESFPRQGYNFLILSLLWFRDLGLAERPTLDYEASVELAKAVSERTAEMGSDLIRFMLPTAVTDRHCIQVVDGANEIDAAVALASFLSWKEHTDANNDDFIHTMRHDHRTIQQSFTRLIMTWCRWLDRSYSAGSKSRTALLARTICSCDRALPYI